MKYIIAPLVMFSSHCLANLSSDALFDMSLEELLNIEVTIAQNNSTQNSDVFSTVVKVTAYQCI